MAPRPLTAGAPDGFMRTNHAKECLAATVPARFFESEADTHNHVAPTPASEVCVNHETASTPFVHALRAPGAAC
jgi:hypothetical protein